MPSLSPLVAPRLTGISAGKSFDHLALANRQAENKRQNEERLSDISMKPPVVWSAL